MRVLDHEGLKAKGIKYTRQHLHRLVVAGAFPRPLKIGGGGRLCWVESEIDSYIKKKIAERDGNVKAA